MSLTARLNSWWAKSDRRSGDDFTVFARAFSGRRAVKRYANVEGYQVLISMIDESVNQSIQESINELKSQLVDKVIINVPLETEQAQKIAADNDDIVCLFLDVDPTAPCLTFRLIRLTAPARASNICMKWAIGRLRCWPGRKLRLGKIAPESWIETLAGYGLQPVTVIRGNWDAQSGYAGALQMLRETPKFTAVLVGNDQMALGY